MNRVTQHLGTKYPIVQAPMGWIARSQLASAVSNSGGLGVIETSSGEVDACKKEIKKMSELTDKPFGVNLPIMFLQDDSIQTVNGIRGEGDNVFEVNRALLSHQNEENTLLIFYAQHSNIAPFNFAVKTYFAHKERDLDQLFHNYKSSKNMRILLLSDGMTELRDEKWEHWQRLIHSQEKWTHVRFKTKHYKLSFIDTKATFLSDD